MPQLIKDRAVVEDRWTLLREATSLAAVPPTVRSSFRSRCGSRSTQALAARGDVGVWLTPADDPAALAGDIGRLPSDRGRLSRSSPTAAAIRRAPAAREVRLHRRVARDRRRAARPALLPAANAASTRSRVRADRDLATMRSALRRFPRQLSKHRRAYAVPLFRRRVSASAERSASTSFETMRTEEAASPRPPPDCPSRSTTRRGARQQLRRRGHGADRPDRAACAADRHLHARHRAPARTRPTR